MRAARLAFAITLLAASCGAPPAPSAPPAAGSCQADGLAACEQRLAAAFDAELLASYLAARSARDPGDPWADLARRLAESPPQGALLLAEAGASPASSLPAVAVPALPPPRGLGADALLLAVLRAAHVPLAFHARGAEISALIPDDPLAPFLPALAPVFRAEAAHLDAEAALAALLREALEAANGLDYVEAARAADALAEKLAASPPGPAAARARLGLQLLAGAGIQLEPPAPAKPAPESPPAAGETPYAAYVAVATAKDPPRAWAAREAAVLGAIPADRREAVRSLFARPTTCGAEAAPPLDDIADLVFAPRLAPALARDAAPRPGQLAFPAWMARYEALVRLVSRSRAAWWYLPSLLAERGEGAGMATAGTAVYRQVTELGRAHLASSRRLLAAHPARTRASGVLALGMSPGLLADPPLQKALTELAEAAVKERLAAAREPEAVLSAVATGALSGLSYPPALQEAHLGALQGAVTAKLKGDFALQTGWGVAALYAAEGAYRLLAEARPNLDFSARQVVRALEAKDVPYPALAALARAGARYAALGAAQKLDPTVTREDRIPAERKAARAALRKAIAGLGAPGEAPEKVLDDLTALADGLTATLSVALSGKKAAKAPRGPVCEAAPAVALDPRTRAVLAKLGDVRGRLLGHPRLKKGEGLFDRRARLLATLLSDALDLARASDTRRAPVFAVPAAEASLAVRGALAEVEAPGAAESAAAAYALLRTYAGSTSAEGFVAQGSRDLRRLAGGLLTLFGGGDGMSTALLQALAGQGASLGEAPAAALIGYAETLYAAGRRDQADLCLLGALSASRLSREPLPAKAAALADEHGSPLGGALRFLGEIGRPAPDPAVYAEGLRRATDDPCQSEGTEATIAVARAIHDFAGGRRAEARASLGRVLAAADERGLGVPRVAYRYEERTATRVFQADVEVSFGSGALDAGTTYNLGLGVHRAAEPGGSLTATLLTRDAPRAGEDAARYYVYTAALAAAYHLLEGDTAGAIAAARRVTATLAGGVKLGPRRLRAGKPAAYGEDARELILLDAQLAAEAGLPFLAGDLWTVAKQGLPEGLDDRAVAGMLEKAPWGLGAVPEVAAALARAKRSLAVLADPLPCTHAKVETGGFEEVACEAYPLAVSLRIADALKKLPRLKRKAETSARCPAWKSLDAFLAAADRGGYDPDAFTRAVDDLRAAGKDDDAAVLLARQKHPSHCSPGLVAAARALGRAALLGPSLRADLLSAAVNCTAAVGGPEVAADVLLLDDETRRLPDPGRNLALVLSVADLAHRSDRWETLGKLVERPDFTSRWMSQHPSAAAAALLLDQAVSALRGEPADADRARTGTQLLCEAFPAQERAETCASLAALRAPQSTEERKRAAKAAVGKLLASMSGKPKP
jgi:hypothetical protein